LYAGPKKWSPTGKARGTIYFTILRSIASPLLSRLRVELRRVIRRQVAHGLCPFGEHLAEAKALSAFIHGQSPWSFAKADKKID
jgi:hypothetical protein